jgi:hypothetical protein
VSCVAEACVSHPAHVPVWALRPGDTIRLPFHYPQVVTVKDGTCAGVACDRVHWRAGNDYGSLVLPKWLEIILLAREDMR